MGVELPVARAGTLAMNMTKCRSAQSGIALLLSIIFLLLSSLMALGAFLYHQQQLQYRALEDEHIYERDLAIHNLFDELARNAANLGANNIQQKIVLSGRQNFMNDSLRYYMEDVNCVHPNTEKSTTRCWELSIEHTATGFTRRRRLHVTGQGCESYWYIAEK